MIDIGTYYLHLSLSCGFLGVWRIDEKCLAPYLDNGELKEAVVKSIQHKEDDLSYAVVSFMDTTERKVPLRHLRKSHGNSNSWNTSIFDDEDLEKPYFPDRRPAAPAANFPLSNSGVFVPYTINRYLRDYQRDGIRFLYEHYTRSTGCILGDDMGLGKTIQVFFYFFLLREIWELPLLIFMGVTDPE